MAQFLPGKSGNPFGRPPGVMDCRTKWRHQLEQDAPEILAKCVSMALEGDATALKLCIERLAPPIRARAEPICFELAQDQGLVEQGSAVLAAVAQGILSPDVGEKLLSSLAGLGRLKELDEFERRIVALENKHAT